MKRYIRASDYRQFIDQMEHLVVHTDTPYSDILEKISAEFEKTSATTQRFKQRLDHLFSTYAPDSEISDLVDEAAVEIEDLEEYNLFCYYLDRKYRDLYS